MKHCLVSRHSLLVLASFWATLFPVALQAQSPLRVVVAIEPQAFLVERIGGERVQVQVLIHAGQDPHTFQITPRQVKRLAQADLLFTSRTPFEERLNEKIALTYPHLPIKDIAAGIQRRWSDEHAHSHTHTETPGHEDDETAPHTDKTKSLPVTVDLPSSTSLIATDPHIWLSPRFLRLQAQTIATALSDTDPSNQEFYNKNLQHLLEDLDTLHKRITDRLAPWRGRVFYVYHPAFGCFADDYGLTQKAVEIEGKDPTARQLSQLVEQARAERIRILFTEVQFNPRSAGILAEAIGAQVRRLDPLARDVLKNLDSIATELAESFQEKAP